MDKKVLRKITVDRKIIEHLIDGKSVTQIQKILNKGKGYILSVRDLALDYNYIVAIAPGEKRYKAGIKQLPKFPESAFAIVDKNTNTKILETDEYLESEKPWIIERLDIGWSPQTIFEELSKPVARATFYRYLHRHGLMQAASQQSSSEEILHIPGECLQVDWAKLFDVVDPVTGKKKTISVFIGIMGFSRYQMVRVVERLDFKTTITSLESMFKELGGVPRKVTSDNPKVFVNAASDYEPLLNPGYERFAAHYGFRIEALRPSDPQSKGKVERNVQYVRRLFESYDNKNYCMKTAQDHINTKNELANMRKHGTHLQKPLEVFLNAESLKLTQLPTLSYELESLSYAKVRLDGYVRFENKYYRIHDKYRGEECLIIGNQRQVTIYCKGLLLEVYERITDSFVSKSCKDHYRQDFEKTMRDHGHFIRRGEKLGLDVARFIEIILARGEGFVDLRVVWGLLALDKKYKADLINQACREAIEMSQVNLRTVYSLLRLLEKSSRIAHVDQSSNEEPVEQKPISAKFVRPMSVYKKHLHLVH